MGVPGKRFLGDHEIEVFWEQTWPAWSELVVCRQWEASIISGEDHINFLEGYAEYVGDISFGE